MVRQDSLLQERYRIVRQLGRGGMGTVYEATDEKFGTPVALKEIIFETSDAKQRELLGNAFQREAKSLATARHECVPFVRDHFHEDNYQYLVMELVEGDDLGRLLEDRKKPFYLDEVIDWMRQLLDALDYLHNLDPPIIHRDIKPNNLKLTSRKRLKLLDFGIAKSGEISAVTTKNQTFVGATLEYSPIEQMLHVVDATFREFLILQHETSTKEILGQRTDARADIFSAGSTFYHLLTGQLPEYATKRALALWEGRPDPLPHPSDLNASIPRRFGDFLLTAMSIARDDRFASAAEMLATLEIVASANSESVPATRAKTARLSKKPAAHIMPPNVPPVEREMADIDPALAETDQH